MPENNLFIVGDDNQMIYGFRGAEVKHILEFNRRYSITTDQVLKINYRSCNDIVKHSKWLIDHNKLRVPKDITSFSEEKGEINLFIGKSLKDQAEKVAQWILENKNHNTKWSDFAILYRYNQYSDLLYIILSKFDIPVQFDGIKILNSEVSRCVLSYLTIIYDSKNSKAEHYEIILKKPNKYLTNEFIKKIRCWDDFINLDSAAASSIVNAIVEEFGLKQFYKDQSKLSADIDAASNYDILEIIMSLSESFENIETFYNYWTNLDQKKDSNLKDNSDKNVKDKVILTTIHRTKGNEYKNVAYYNLSSRVTEKATETELEEERRVAYVGVTRAKKSLMVTSQQKELSPFVKEFFLNPKLRGIMKQELHNKISILDAESNVLKVNLHQIDELIEELTTNYPELKGKYVKITGWFKKIKQNLRQKNINIALEKYNYLNEQKNDIYRKNTLLINEKIDIKTELEYRNIIA